MHSRHSKIGYRALSVRLRLRLGLGLQADRFAELQLQHAQKSRQILENVDVEEVMNVAAKIGDDAPKRPGCESFGAGGFTHGASAGLTLDCAPAASRPATRRAFETDRV